MPRAERRFWLCPRGHVIGEVKHLVVGESRVRALQVYEISAVTVGLAEQSGHRPIRARVIGDVDGIRCTVDGCGCTRDWHLGEDAFAEMMARVVARRAAAAALEA